MAAKNRQHSGLKLCRIKYLCLPQAIVNLSTAHSVIKFTRTCVQIFTFRLVTTETSLGMDSTNVHVALISLTHSSVMTALRSSVVAGWGCLSHTAVDK